MELGARLAEVLGAVVPVDVEPDGALTVRYEGTFASLRAVTIADDIEMVSVTQVLAWDLPLNADLRKRVAGTSTVDDAGDCHVRGDPASTET